MNQIEGHFGINGRRVTEVGRTSIGSVSKSNILVNSGGFAMQGDKLPFGGVRRPRKNSYAKMNLVD